MNKELLNRTMETLSHYICRYKNEGRRIFATSSFQTQSVPLLHILSQHFPETLIVFMDTGFLFPETYAFKNDLEKSLKLNSVSLRSELSLDQQKDTKTGLFQYALDPDKCCFINKVKPLEAFRKESDVWVSGVRRDQTSIRKKMDVIQKDGNTIKFHPMLEWTAKDIYRYMAHFDLPKHPLENEGYQSIGCIPCTHKMSIDDQRGGRWKGSRKTECGLHSDKK